MTKVCDRVPGSPSLGCYQRFVAMRRKRSDSITSKLESIRKRSLKEDQRSASALNINIAGMDSNDNPTEKTRSLTNLEYGENGITRKYSNGIARTTPRAKKIRDRMNRRRSGSVPNVDFQLQPSTQPTASTFFAPSRPVRKYSTITPPVLVEQRCLQLLIEDIDGGTTTAGRKASTLTREPEKLSVPQPAGRRRSLPALFAGRDQTPLSLFKHSAPSLLEEPLDEVTDGNPPKRSATKTRKFSLTIPLFPWKRNGPKNRNSSKEYSS